MFIEMKKSYRASEPIYIFKFINQEDFDLYIKNMEALKETPMFEYLEPEYSERMLVELNRTIETLKSRTDDKYKDEDYQLSGMLFAREALCFFNVLNDYAFFVSQIFEIVKQKQELELTKQELELTTKQLESLKNIL